MDAEVEDPRLLASSARLVTRLTAIRALLGGAVLVLTLGAPDLNGVLATKRKARKRKARTRHKATSRRRRQTDQSAAPAQPAAVTPSAPASRPDPIIIEDPCEAFPEVCGCDGADPGSA